MSDDERCARAHVVIHNVDRVNLEAHLNEVWQRHIPSRVHVFVSFKKKNVAFFLPTTRISIFNGLDHDDNKSTLVLLLILLVINPRRTSLLNTACTCVDPIQSSHVLTFVLFCLCTPPSIGTTGSHTISTSTSAGI